MVHKIFTGLFHLYMKLEGGVAGISYQRGLQNMGFLVVFICRESSQKAQLGYEQVKRNIL